MSIRSERIKLIIEESGKSYQELEKITGIKKSSLQRYATGATAKIPVDVIDKLSKTFNVDADYLLGVSDIKKRREFKVTRTNKSIAHNIQHHREQANLSKKEFADLLGVDETTITDLESSKSTLKKDMLYNICDVLHLIPSNIIPRDDEEFTEDEEYLLSRREKNSPDQLVLTEREKKLIYLLRQIPEQNQEMAFEMVRAAVNTQLKQQ